MLKSSRCHPRYEASRVDDAYFVRHDVMNKLAVLWSSEAFTPSVVLHGPRWMGKTSVLQQVANRLAKVQVVYVSLASCVRGATLRQVLLAISNGVATTLDIAAPSRQALGRHPVRTFERYLKQAVAGMADGEKLIIAIDNYEILHDLVAAGQWPSDFIHDLHYLMQISPKLGFVLAGLPSLACLATEAFRPLRVSVIELSVGYLELQAVRHLLLTPTPSVLVTYGTDAIERIFELTAGQPYLTQLIGFQRIHDVNGLGQRPWTSDLGTRHAVDQWVESERVFDWGDRYFWDRWREVRQDAPHSLRILERLAPHGQGLHRGVLEAGGALDGLPLDPVLTRLERTQVIERRGDRVRIRVELFRRWLLRRAARRSGDSGRGGATVAA